MSEDPILEDDLDTGTEADGDRDEPTPPPAKPAQKPTKPAPKPAPEPEPDDDYMSIDDACEQLRASREREKKAAAQARKERERREEIERAQREAEEAKLTEQQKAQRYVRDLEGKAQSWEQRATHAENEVARLQKHLIIIDEAYKLDFAYPGDVIHQPEVFNRVEPDEVTGEIDKAAVRKTLEKFAKDRPEYLKSYARGGTGPLRNDPGSSRRLPYSNHHLTPDDLARDLNKDGSYFG